MTLLKLMPHERAHPYTKAVRLLPAEKFIERVHTKMGPSPTVKSKFRSYVSGAKRARWWPSSMTIRFRRSVQLLAEQRWLRENVATRYFITAIGGRIAFSIFNFSRTMEYLSRISPHRANVAMYIKCHFQCL